MGLQSTGHRVTGLLPGGQGGVATFRRLAERRGAATGAGTLEFRLWGARVALAPDAERAAVTVAAEELQTVRMLQDMLAEAFSADGLAVVWDDAGTGELAPNLALMTVASIRAPSPGFARVTLAGPEAARFGASGLHFRLLLPPEGRAPRWPRVAETGRSVWPEGPDALHRPVFTTLANADDWLEFDVFRHADSPTCDWLDRARPGEVVGVMGPGGGWCPDASPLALFGDETALPAIARMLDLAKGEVRDWARVAAADLGALAGDPRVTRVDDLLPALRAHCPVAGGHVWFAAGEAETRAARAHLATLGLAKRDFTVATYWR